MGALAEPAVVGFRVGDGELLEYLLVRQLAVWVLALGFVADAQSRARRSASVPT